MVECITTPPREAKPDTAAITQSVIERILAISIDGLILSVNYLFLSFVFFGVDFWKTFSLLTPEPDQRKAAVVGLLARSAAIFYFARLHSERGASIGKLVLRLRVETLDGARPPPSNALLRAIVPLVAFVARDLSTAIGLSSLAGFLGWVGIAILLADAAVLLVDLKHGRSLHDRIAGTRVVRGN